MRRVILQMGVTLDGYVAGPGGELDWGLPEEHRDVRAWKVASLRQVGTHIIGRVTYEAMAAHWPTASERGLDIMAHGGATFVQALSQRGLIDEYRLIVHPVALGSGLPLFKDLAEPVHLHLADAERFPDGTVIHVYQRITRTEASSAAK